MCKFYKGCWRPTECCGVYDKINHWYALYMFGTKSIELLCHVISNIIDDQRKDTKHVGKSHDYSKAQNHLGTINYRLNYIFDNFSECEYVSRTHIEEKSYDFLDLATKLYELGGTAKRNEAIVIAAERNNKKLFDSVVIGKDCEYFVNQSTIEKVADKPYCLSHIVQNGYNISDELLTKCFEKYRKTLMDNQCLPMGNSVDSEGTKVRYKHAIEIEANIYFEKKLIFPPHELNKVLDGSYATNAINLIKAH